jgi:hypothetical protein
MRLCTFSCRSWVASTYNAEQGGWLRLSNVMEHAGRPIGFSIPLVSRELTPFVPYLIGWSWSFRRWILAKDAQDSEQQLEQAEPYALKRALNAATRALLP